MSLQYASAPALLIAAGAVIEAPPPEAVVWVVVADVFLLLPPQPAARRATRRTRAPASAVVFERDTAGLLSLIGLTKIRLSDLLVAEKRLRVVGQGNPARLEHV